MADACITNNSGFSAVFAAVAGGHLRVLKLLMQYGTELTVTRHCGITLLYSATCSSKQRAT
jgi:hypothetical protein